MPVILPLVIVGLSVLVGWLGRRRTIGFAGFFVLSLVLSPFIMALVLMVSGQRRPVRPLASR